MHTVVVVALGKIRWAVPVMGAVVLVTALAAPAPAKGAAKELRPPRARQSFTDWPVYHLDALRTGFDPNTPAIGKLSSAWSASLDQGVYAEPLLVGGRVIAATENDTVYALDPATGSVLWKRHLGTPVPLDHLPCGNIDPLGITGTPAFDPASGRLFVAAEILNGTKVAHRLYALDPSDGTVLKSRSLDHFRNIPDVEQQRAALAVGNGRVYVAFGALAGDCGDFHGYVIASDTAMAERLKVYSALKYVSSADEGGIWATAGPSITPSGDVFVAVGNGSIAPPFDLSDSVLKLSPTLRLRTYFAPTTWLQDNQIDADLGSMGPALVGSYVYADGKSGIAYLMKAGHLGHIGGEIDSAAVCRAFGGTALMKTTLFVPCADGIRAVDVGSGSIVVRWHTTATSAVGPPVVGGGAVWSIGRNGFLYALDQADGSQIASISVGSVEHFASPTLSGGFVFVPTQAGITAIKGA